MSDAMETIAYKLSRLEPGDALARVRSFREDLSQRRSVRMFSRDAVSVELIEEAVRAAGLAPSGANQQPWKFVLVSSNELKVRMREAAEQEERLNYQGRMSAEWREALAHLGTDEVKEHITDAPFVMVVFEVVHGIGANGERIQHYYTKESVGIAVGFLVAALHRAGLATLTHTPSPMNFLRDLLGRPVNEKAFVLMPIGYPAEDCRVPKITKKSLEEILLRK